MIFRFYISEPPKKPDSTKYEEFLFYASPAFVEHLLVKNLSCVTCRSEDLLSLIQWQIN